MEHWRLLLFLVASCVSGCAGAESRVSRPLDVRSDGVKILACVPIDEGEDVVVADAGVSAIGFPANRLSSPWSMSAVEGNPKLSLSPGECLVFGVAPDGYVANSPEAALKEGQPYTFSVRSPEWGKYRTRLHSGVFCVNGSGADVEVVQVPLSHRAVTAETCRQLFDAMEGAR